MTAFSETAPDGEPSGRFELIELQLAHDLTDLVDRGGTLLSAIGWSRRQVAVDTGVVFPPVHVRDNLSLALGEYRICVRGVSVCTVETKPGKMLAIDPGDASGIIDGEATTDPTFGLDAVWIDPGHRAKVEDLGYTCVSVSVIISTHLTEIIKHRLADFFGLGDTKKLLDTLALDHPELVAEVLEHLSLRDVLRVLRGLLAEQISIRDLEVIVDTLAEHLDDAHTVEERIRVVRERLAGDTSPCHGGTPAS